MKCNHCESEKLGGRFIKSTKSQADKFKRYFRYCKSCGFNSYYDFPSYLDKSQFEKWAEQSTKKVVNRSSGRKIEYYQNGQNF